VPSRLKQLVPCDGLEPFTCPFLLAESISAFLFRALGAFEPQTRNLKILEVTLGSPVRDLPCALQIRLRPARDRQFDIDGRHAGNQVVFFVGDRRQSCGGDRRLTVTRGQVRLCLGHGDSIFSIG
jgi:hypothetical protein